MCHSAIFILVILREQRRELDDSWIDSWLRVDADGVTTSSILFLQYKQTQNTQNGKGKTGDKFINIKYLFLWIYVYHKKIRFQEDALSLLSKAKQWYNISYVSLICLGGGLLIYIIMYIRVAGNSLHFLASVIVWAFIICLKANTIMAISKIIVNLGNLAKDVGEAKA